MRKNLYYQAAEEFEHCMSKDEFRGVCAFFMANIYDLKKEKEKSLKMIEEALNYVRYTGPFIRYELCIIMWEKNLIEQLRKFLPIAIGSLNFDNRFISLEGREEALKKLNEINLIIRGEKEIDLFAGENTIKKESIQEREEEVPKKKDIFSDMYIDLISIEAGRGLLNLVKPGMKVTLLDYIKPMRKYFAIRTGVVFPEVYIRDNLCLKPHEYIIKIKDVKVAGGKVFIDRLLAVNENGDFSSLEGLKCFEPLYGMAAIWIRSDDRKKAEELGCAVFDSLSVIAGHFAEVIGNYRHEFLGIDEVKRMVDNLKKTHPNLTEEIYPALLSLGKIQKVMKNLAKEKVSIRDLPIIFETLGNYSHITKDADLLTEYVRQDLSRTLCCDYKDSKEVINVITIEEEMENSIAGSIVKTDYGSFLTLDRSREELMLSQLEKEIKKFTDKGLHPIVLCSPQIRLYVRRFTERFFQNLTVLSYNEIAPKVTVNSLGELRLAAPKKDSNTYLFSYIEKMWTDKKAIIRREAIKALRYYASENNMDWITYYTDRGLEDKDEAVRYETVKLIRELYERKLNIF